MREGRCKAEESPNATTSASTYSIDSLKHPPPMIHGTPFLRCSAVLCSVPTWGQLVRHAQQQREGLDGSVIVLGLEARIAPLPQSRCVESGKHGGTQLLEVGSKGRVVGIVPAVQWGRAGGGIAFICVGGY